MTKLHQLIAIEKTVAKTAEDGFTKVYQDAQKADLFTGITKTYAPLADDGYQLPPESKKVLRTSEGLLTDAQAYLEKLFDHVATKDYANQSAAADIIVNGVTLATMVPVSTLLWLEKRLVGIREFISKLQVLDPLENWTYDESNGTWRSDPLRTVRQTKKVDFIVPPGGEATKEHKAQIVQVNNDVIEGTWTAVKLSGAIPALRKQALLVRVDELTKAVKVAREEANSIQVVDKSIGNSLLNYLFSH